MNTILIVLPILTILMFDLGLTLRRADFVALRHLPRGVMAGLLGQIVALPVLAFMLGYTLHLSPVWFLGVMLIACSPGGSSSNVFSMLAGGDVALSVSLTAFSSIITLVTIPIIMSIAMAYMQPADAIAGGAMIHLPVGQLIMQNVVLMLVPILLGAAISRYRSSLAARLHAILSRCAFPALIFLAAIFFFQHRNTIAENIGALGTATTLLILLSMGVGYMLSKAFRLDATRRRTIIIEVGMQNAAQAIAVAVSPFVFNSAEMAIPAIVYALMMNVILLIYVAVIRRINIAKQ